MIKKIILLMLVLSIILTSCQKVEPETSAEPSSKPTETAEASDDISIEPDVSEINALDAELNSEELDSIEADLDEINW